MNPFRYSPVLVILFLVSCALAPKEITPPSTPTLAPTEETIPQTSTIDIGSTVVSDTDGMQLVFVPAGEFIMGSDVRDDEMPIHTVSLDAFWIDQTEVTNAMYAKCVADGACAEPTSKQSRTHSDYYDNHEFENYPVIYVEWNMAKAYCEWADRRLPTEAEWEKTARGDDGRTYPWGNESPNENLLNFAENIGDTTEVGAYPNGGSVYGALDMAGNVYEWVGSLYQPYPYDPEDGREELDTKRGIVYRGGSWLTSDNVARSANRADFGPTGYSQNDIGFRCAASGTP